MTLNVTFLSVFVSSLVTMWLGTLISFSWNKILTRDNAWKSLLVCLVLSLILAGVITLMLSSMGLVWEEQM